MTTPPSAPLLGRPADHRSRPQPRVLRAAVRVDGRGPGRGLRRVRELPVRGHPRRRVHAQRRHCRRPRPLVGLPRHRRRRGDRRPRGRARRPGDGAGDGRDDARAHGRRRRRRRRGHRHVAAGSSTAASGSTTSRARRRGSSSHTRDYDASLAFYRDVFGWKTKVESDAPEFRYTTLDVRRRAARGRDGRGGVPARRCTRGLVGLLPRRRRRPRAVGGRRPRRRGADGRRRTRRTAGSPPPPTPPAPRSSSSAEGVDDGDLRAPARRGFGRVVLAPGRARPARPRGTTSWPSTSRSPTTPAGFAEYADCVVDAVGDRRDLVLVAQSLAGFTAPLVCERVPVDLMILVAAMVPRPGESAR